MTDVYLGLGSNMGDRAAHLAHAVARLRDVIRVTGVSSVYETDPVGDPDQRAYLNMVVRGETELGPPELLEATRRIEMERGRVRGRRNAPRTLDIDLLLHGAVRLGQDDLTLPHPRLAERAFVLVPLAEVAPDLVEPGTGRSYRKDLLPVVAAGSDVRLIAGPEAVDRVPLDGARDA